MCFIPKHVKLLDAIAFANGTDLFIVMDLKKGDAVRAPNGVVVQQYISNSQ